MNSNKLELARIHLGALEVDSQGSRDLRDFKTSSDRVASSNHSETYLKNLRNSLVAHLRAEAEGQHKLAKRAGTLLLIARSISWTQSMAHRNKFNSLGQMFVAHARDPRRNQALVRRHAGLVVVLDSKQSDKVHS